MRKIRNVLLLVILLIFFGGCHKTPEYFTIKNSRGETLKITLLKESELQYYESSIQEADKILQAYLGDSYNKGKLNPVTIKNESQTSNAVPYGVTHKGKVYINLDWYPENSRELVRTIVHEELHFQNPKGLNLTEISESSNTKLSEYIVYYLTRKLCTSYDVQKYGNMYYGNVPNIPELDSYRDELSEVYLGREELSRELLKLVVDVMRDN